MTAELVIYSITGIASMLIVCLIIFLGDLERNGRIDIMNPGLVFPGLFLLYHATIFLEPATWSVADAVPYAFLISVAIMGIAVGSGIAHIIEACGNRQEVQSPVVDRGRLVRCCLALVLVSTVMIVLMYEINVGISRLPSLTSRERNAAQHGILTGFFFILPIGAGLALPLLLARRTLKDLIFIGLIFGFLFALFYLASSRSELLHAMILGTIVYHFCVKTIPKRVILTLGILMITAMMTLSIVRANINADAADIAKTISLESLGTRFQLDHFEFYTTSKQNLELVAWGPPDGNFLWGSSLVYFLPNLIPNMLQPPWERPVLLDRWYVLEHHPIIARTGGGLGFSPLIDAYFNFGAFGCFLFYMLFAVFLNTIHNRAMRAPSLSRLRFIDGLLFTTLIVGQRISISGYVKNYLVVFVLLGAIVVTFCLKRNDGGIATKEARIDGSGTRELH